MGMQEGFEPVVDIISIASAPKKKQKLTANKVLGRGMNLKSWRMSHWYVFMVGVAVVTGTAAAPASFEGNSEEGVEGGHERVRRAAFNSWAGKRNSMESDTITIDEEGLSKLIQDIADSILAQHNSGEKRASFNSWAGRKRAFSLSGLQSRINDAELQLPHKIRRKRSSGENGDSRERRSAGAGEGGNGGSVAFSSWGGKRSVAGGDPLNRVVRQSDINNLRRLARSTSFSA